MSKERFKITPFSAVILRKDNKILLMKRASSAISGGFYAFPGGGIDGAETITTATVREAQEEIGITLDPKDLKFVHALHVMMENGQEYINFFFQSTKWEGEPKVIEPHKCDGVAWFDIDQLPESIMPTHKHVVNLISKNIGFSEFGWE